jgi:hypothetical protein
LCIDRLHAQLPAARERLAREKVRFKRRKQRGKALVHTECELLLLSVTSVASCSIQTLKLRERVAAS